MSHLQTAVASTSELNSKPNRVHAMTEPTNKTYRRVLVRFFSYLHKKNYVFHHQFQVDDFLAVRPSDIVKYMNLKVYGKEVPDVSDRTTLGRSNTLVHIKKSLSAFFPRKSMKWDELRAEGSERSNQKS